MTEAKKAAINAIINSDRTKDANDPDRMVEYHGKMISKFDKIKLVAKEKIGFQAGCISAIGFTKDEYNMAIGNAIMYNNSNDEFTSNFIRAFFPFAE